MTTPRSNRIHIRLDLRDLDDEKRDAFVTSLEDLAPESPLYLADATVQESVADLLAAGGGLSAARDALNRTLAQLAADRTNVSEARDAFDRKLVLLKTLVETRSKNGAGVSSMCFVWRGPMVRHPLAVPEGAVGKPGKAHGQVIFAVAGDRVRRRYAGEYSTDQGDPVTWTRMDGDGKTRKLSGLTSGTRVWGRFATVRGHDQSDWCTPAAVIVP
jgi:hypothetical protein